jgi:hypothetical protein
MGEPARIATPGREACRQGGCFATFDDRAAAPDEVRHCNRTGPEGGHTHRWNGKAWNRDGAMEHDGRP